jgi:hypothetical protein
VVAGGRIKTVLLLLAVLAGFFFAGSALALNPGDRVDNFRLLDQTGASHELYYFSDAKAVVLMTYGNGCGIDLRRRALRKVRQNRLSPRALPLPALPELLKRRWDRKDQAAPRNH